MTAQKRSPLGATSTARRRTLLTPLGASFTVVGAPICVRSPPILLPTWYTLTSWDTPASPLRPGSRTLREVTVVLLRWHTRSSPFMHTFTNMSAEPGPLSHVSIVFLTTGARFAPWAARYVGVRDVVSTTAKPPRPPTAMMEPDAGTSDMLVMWVILENALVSWPYWLALLVRSRVTRWPPAVIVPSGTTFSSAASAASSSSLRAVSFWRSAAWDLRRLLNLNMPARVQC
mmetsp:Transcript_17104/g.52858  ORF Transcript_17104/g.52858 Transcript_17104/m.52858 type:complete len:230 (+) Transcript_17104:2233-2922(+)